MQRLLLIIALPASLILAGCSSNPNAIEPRDLERYEKVYKSDRLWRSGAGKGTDEQSLSLEPAVAGDRIYAGDVDGRVYAFSRDRGKRQWKVKTGERLSGGMSAAYGMVVFGTRDGQVVALDANDGQELWRAQLSSEVLASPAVASGRVIAQTLDGRVSSLSLEGGDIEWTYETTVPVLTLRGSASPLVVGDRVYAAFASGKVAALDISTGVPVWERRVAEPQGRSELDRMVDIDGNLVVEGGGVFAATFQGKLAVMEEESGRIFWDRDMSTARRIASHQGVLFIADEVGKIHAVDQRSGNALWVNDKLYGRKLIGMVVHKGLVVTGDYKGYLHWIDPEEGKIVSRRRADWDGFAGPLLVRDDVLYLLSADGKLSAFDILPRKKAAE